MKYQVIKHPKQKTYDGIILGVFKNKSALPLTSLHFDKMSKKFISKLIKSGDFTGRSGQTLMLYNVPGIPAKKVLLIGCGDKIPMPEHQYIKLLRQSTKLMADHQCKTLLTGLSAINVNKRDHDWKLRQAVIQSEAALYRFDQCKSKPQKTKHSLKQIDLASQHSDLSSANNTVKQGSAISQGINLAKDLGNLPSNICTPTYLANQAKKLATKFSSIRTKILAENELKKLSMGAFLAVARGSQEPAKLIICHYQGAKKKSQAPIALVGKGVTFDSGGISIKPSIKMDEMKYDMCGAASVLGTLQAIAELKLPVNVIGVIAAAENLPGGKAYKPGDIVTSSSGKTIEILNTDAEGRLLLCDALTYCERFKPETVIDIATLTGAMVISLGSQVTGMMTNNPALAAALKTAGEQTYDRIWELPLWDEYQSDLDSHFADLANVGSRAAGAISAACFLSRFCEKFVWAHLDIAGTAWKSAADQGATGRPVHCLTQFIINNCNGK